MFRKLAILVLGAITACSTLSPLGKDQEKNKEVIFSVLQDNTYKFKSCYEMYIDYKNKKEESIPQGKIYYSFSLNEGKEVNDVRFKEMNQFDENFLYCLKEKLLLFPFPLNNSGKVIDVKHSINFSVLQ